MLNIVVFVSGRGSNLKAILDAENLNNLIKVCCVLSDKVDCPAFNIAKDNSIPTFSIGNSTGCISYEKALALLKMYKTDYVVLAGYLKLLPDFFVNEFENKIINIHPALLPDFGGKGMYGMNVHRAVFSLGKKFSGPTIHFVDSNYDTGKIIAQSKVDISSAVTPEDIAAIVLEEEHILLPLVLEKLAKGKVKIINENVIIEE